MKKWGWRPQIPDYRDFKFAFKPRAVEIPQVVYNLCPPVRDQGELGSCVFCSLASLMESCEAQNNHQDWWVFSPLFSYYNYRDDYGNIYVDDGAYIREAIKTIAEDGICRESLWPYIEDRWDDKPSREAYNEAQGHQILSYHALPQTLEAMLSCLAEGYNFVGGISVYSNYETAEYTGHWPLPADSASLLGGHAMMFWGYDQHNEVFHGINSWGTEWGREGRFTIPFSYLTSPGLASDFWTVRLVEES